MPVALAAKNSGGEASTAVSASNISETSSSAPSETQSPHVSRETFWIANAYEKGGGLDDNYINMAINELNGLPQNIWDEIGKLSDSIANSNGKQALFRLIGMGFRIENGDIKNEGNMAPDRHNFQFHKLSNADKLEAIRIFNESVNYSKWEGNIQMAFIEFVKEHQPKNIEPNEV
jgi:hypothetical protein